MVSHSRVEEMLQEEIYKAKSIGIMVEPISPVVKFPKAKSFYGMCHRETTKVDGKTYYYYIRISEYFLEAEEDQIRATIMHEVLHACRETRNESHGKKWQELARKVNEAYPQYSIKRVGSQLSGVKDYSLREHAPASCRIKAHEVECTTCGRKWSRTRHSSMTLHPENYFCSSCRRVGLSGKLRLNY